MDQSEFRKQNHKVYLLPGLGADERMYEGQLSHLSMDCEVINWPVPGPGMSLTSYAEHIAHSIDSSRRFSLVGTSLGGIVAVELTKILQPDKVILISSVKTRNELPSHIRSLKYLPVHRMINGHQYKYLNHVLANLLTGKRRTHFDKLIRDMAYDANSFFIEWAINEVIQWQNSHYRKDIVHIHGSKDILFPVRYIENVKVVEGGSHVMALTHSKIISELLEEYLLRD